MSFEINEIVETEKGKGKIIDVYENKLIVQLELSEAINEFANDQVAYWKGENVQSQFFIGHDTGALHVSVNPIYYQADGDNDYRLKFEVKGEIDNPSKIEKTENGKWEVLTGEVLTKYLRLISVELEKRYPC